MIILKITDAEFDKLKKDIIDLSKKISFLKDLIKIVGAKPSNKFRKIKHLLLNVISVKCFR